MRKGIGTGAALLLCALSASAAVAPEISISTTKVPGVSAIPFVGEWREVAPDAALKKKLEVYRRAQTRTHTRAVAAGFEPAQVDARDAGGNPTTYYVDFRKGFSSDSNAFAGDYEGVRSVWYNHSGFLERESETDNLYTVAHEFFHSIFNPVVKKRGLWAIPVVTRLKWMSEGIPTAVGQIALEGFDGTSLEGRAKAGSRHGVRALGARYLDYPIDLRDEYPMPTSGMWFESLSADATAVSQSYATSSFWHHVAVKSGGLGWVKKFIDRPAPSDKSSKGFVDWAEKGIQRGGRFANFADAYNSYIASFVDYPYLNETSEKDYFAWGKWQSLLFMDGCRRIVLAAGAEPVKHIADIRPLASECLRVKVTGLPPKAANIFVTLAGATDRQCSDLNVVSGRKTPLQSPKVNADGSCDWHWQFAYDPLTANARDEQVFVITNVRPDKPSLTAMVKGATFKFSVPALAVTASGSATADSSTNSAQAAGAPAKPQKKVKAPAKASAKAGQIAAIGFNVSKSESLLPYRGSGCDALTRAIRPCGPYTQLTLQWGEIADLGVEMMQSQYGVANGDFSQFGEIARKLPKSLEQAARLSGASIELQFPRIERGATGSFSNAMISLSLQDDGDEAGLESLSPKFVRPGHNPDCPEANAIYPYDGKVNIESYDASGISGSFSADFYETSEGSCPKPVKVASVSGRFRNPPLRDEVQEDYEESPAGQKRLYALLVNKFYAMVPETFTPIARAEAWALFAKQMAAQGAGGGTSGGSASRAQTCNCDCAEFDSPRRDACSAQCLGYAPMAAQCVIEREVGKGRSHESVINEINACPSDCPALRGSVPAICGDALYQMRRACLASGPAGISQKQIDCYLDYVVREAGEPMRSEFRKTQAEQLKAMEASARDQFMGMMIDMLKGEGVNCSSP